MKPRSAFTGKRRWPLVTGNAVPTIVPTRCSHGDGLGQRISEEGVAGKLAATQPLFVQAINVSYIRPLLSLPHHREVQRLAIDD